jgi:NAD(P)-dependent dehydrogenase (short-subunit alcohol dehydrogenase family)
MTRTVVVTGGASGIGEATARRFAAGGWTVEIADRNTERGTAVAADIGATFAELDVAEETGVAAYAATVLERRGQVDAVVNSAGILQNAVRYTEMDMAEFDRIHAINVRGSLLVNRAFGTAMSAAGSDSFLYCRNFDIHDQSSAWLWSRSASALMLPAPTTAASSR